MQPIYKGNRIIFNKVFIICQLAAAIHFYYSSEQKAFS